MNDTGFYSFISLNEIQKQNQKQNDVPSEFECLSPRDLAKIVLACEVYGVVEAIRWYCKMTGEISVSLSAAEWLKSQATKE